ncbi:MAG: HNH endonuclease [Nocardioides sp.]|nr:HNH endonuclease [Nocardioides sp.]
MSALQHSHEHRVTALARRSREELSAVAEVPLWSLSAAEAADVLVMLTQARAQLDELLMRVLSYASTVESGLDTGATSTTSWWAHTTRTTRAEAHRTARLATSLEHRDSVRTALAAGDLRTDQASVIVAAVDGLPDDVEAWVPGAATEFLLQMATEHDAKALRVLGRRLLEVIDPAAADAEEARRLAAEERHAKAIASFAMTDDGHGTCHGRFTVPSLHGAMLRKDLLARAASARGRSGEVDRTGDGRFSRHQLGLAFMDYIEARPNSTMPTAGGVAATVVVTMDLETLLGGLKAASLDTGGRISAGEARRLACRAGIIPIVLGGQSVVLDVGRKRRFHSETQRIAMGVRDGGCTTAGCDAPPAFCHAHHDQTPWSRGGGTSVEKGRLLCPRHHTLIHDTAFQHTLDKHGKVRFTRRT